MTRFWPSLSRSVLVTALFAVAMVIALGVQYQLMQMQETKTHALTRAISQANDDLLRGFMHFLLYSETSPWDRDKGRYLMRQAAQSYEGISEQAASSPYAEIGLALAAVKRTLAALTIADFAEYGAGEAVPLYPLLYQTLDAASAFQSKVQATQYKEQVQRYFWFSASALVALFLLARLSQLLWQAQRGQEMAQHRLQESEERWRFALEGAGDGVWDWDTVTGQVSFSHVWRELVGDPPAAEYEQVLRSEDWHARIHPEDFGLWFAALRETLAGVSARFEAEYRIRTQSGQWLWMLDRAVVVSRDESGKPLRVIGVSSDISERKQAQERIWQQAHFDVVTGLPNRWMMQLSLDHELTLVKSRGRRLALLLIDLDHFKEVNDVHGHQAGDAVLVEVAHRLKACLRAADMVSRQGGGRVYGLARAR